MENYEDSLTVRTADGLRAVSGASIRVRSFPALADVVLYSANDNGLPLGPAGTRISTAANGNFSFYAPNGRYRIDWTGVGLTPGFIDDVMLFDPDDFSGGGGGGGGGVDFTIVDWLVPSGAIDGVNTVFTLPSTPDPQSSLDLKHNGLSENLVGYNLSGNTIVMDVAPEVGDTLAASYRVAGAGADFTFVDWLIPVGIIDGGNTIFTLPSVPNPPASLDLELNGLFQIQGTHYNLSGNTIVYITAPELGDNHVSKYRV